MSWIILHLPLVTHSAMKRMVGTLRLRDINPLIYLRMYCKIKDRAEISLGSSQATQDWTRRKAASPSVNSRLERIAGDAGNHKQMCRLIIHSEHGWPMLYLMVAFHSFQFNFVVSFMCKHLEDTLTSSSVSIMLVWRTPCAWMLYQFVSPLSVTALCKGRFKTNIIAITVLELLLWAESKLGFNSFKFRKKLQLFCDQYNKLYFWLIICL